MKQYINLLLLLLLVPAFSFAQDYKYKSREEDEYNKNHKAARFQPFSTDEVSQYKNDFFNFERIEDYTPYNDSLFILPYIDFMIPYQDSVLHTENNAWFANTPQFIGKIDKRFILRYEKKGRIEAFVFLEHEYNSLHGIWVAYSSDDGKSWEYYYTGLMQKKPLFVKWYSKRPLINDAGDLQMEACLFLQKAEFGPWGMEYFKLVEDGLLLTLDLATLRKDADGDGLTDITETLFRTNPKNKDTDGDGIPDNLDLNPRFAMPRTGKTIVFEAVLNADERLYCQDGPCESIPTNEITPVHYATDKTGTVLIVTDDPDLLSVQPVSQRIIFISSEEYAQQQHGFTNGLNGWMVTPLFKADYLSDTWVFSMSSISGSSMESGYYATKTEDGWNIGVTFQLIE